MTDPDCSLSVYHHHWGGLLSVVSTVLMMTICSRLWAGEGGGRSCSTRAWRVSELIVCSWSASKVTWSLAVMFGWTGSVLKVMSAVVLGAGSALELATVATVSAVTAETASALGVAGSGLGGSSSRMETRPLLSWESLLWTKATGWLEARRTTAHTQAQQRKAKLILWCCTVWRHFMQRLTHKATRCPSGKTHQLWLSPCVAALHQHEPSLGVWSCSSRWQICFHTAGTAHRCFPLHTQTPRSQRTSHYSSHSNLNSQQRISFTNRMNEGHLNKRVHCFCTGTDLMW